MTKMEDNQSPRLTFLESAAPGTPASTLGYLYEKTDGNLYFKNDAGTETDLSAAGSVATDAIWDAAGDLAVGTGANTAARLAIGAAGGHVSRINGAVAWDSGTANPTAATGDRYWRTDLGLEVYYDGTRWLTTTLYQVPIGAIDTLTGLTTNHSFFVGLPQDYATYLVSASVACIVLTTNDGSNYWSFQPASTATPNTVTNRGTAATTAANAADTYLNKLITIGVALTTASMTFKMIATKTGAPGNLYMFPLVQYRLIVT